MKTPREILLEQHQAAAPKLDAIRRESVGQVELSVAKPPHPSPLPRWGRGRGNTGKMPVLQLIWRELIFPSRRIWTGLTVVWILILAANFSLRDHSQVAMAKTSTPAEMMTFQQQQELLAQLIGPDEPVVAEPQKKYVPRPSSLRSLPVLVT